MADNPFTLVLLLVCCGLLATLVLLESNVRNSENYAALKIQLDSLKRQIDAKSSSKNRHLTTTDSPFTYASDFGAVGDSTTDDSDALQAAIDHAVDNAGGGTVVLGAGTYYIRTPLELKGGVTLQGQGYGSSPLAIKFDAGSSTIAYCGTGYAIQITGHAASIRDLAIYDWRYPVGSECDRIQAAGGVLIEANGELLESISMSRVLLYFFMGGTALTLRGINNGGIGYASFDDLRVRHARKGIHLQAEAGSFVNSNQFWGGAISGDIVDVAVKAEGPGSCNDNKFYGMVIEPPETSVTHIHVLGPTTNVRMHDVRLEGTKMVDDKRPLVIIEDDSYGNVMNGMLGHTHVQADFLRNPDIDFVGAKTVGIDPPPLNRFSNAAFHGFDGTTLPGWNTPGTNRVITVVPDEQLFADHQVLHIDHSDPEEVFQLSPKFLAKSPAHSQCTFGIYARASVQGAIVATMRYESGNMISSTEHTGSGEWEFIAMSALYDANTKDARPIFFIFNDVDITAPTFVYGSTPATPGASLMSASGANMDGTFGLSMVTVTPPTSGNVWVLPKNGGNIFRLDMQGNPRRTIARINDKTADRFEKGTVITLLFAQAGTVVRRGGYIKLLANRNFSVRRGNSSLTLVSNGDGTWTEITRNS